MIIAKLSADPIDAARLTDELRTPTAGGIVVFEGTTRRGEKASEVIGLEYEAYERRAERQLREIANEAKQRWSLRSIAVVHRVGVVPTGQPGVVVVTVAKHRAEAFDSCRWIIDTVKTEVAIWKREIYADGTSVWVDG